MEAKWKDGFASLHKADANTVANEILSLQDATPRNIVDMARDEKTELHKCFEWNDEKAADEYRLFQARQVVCHLVIKQEDRPQEQTEVRFFYKAEAGVGYTPSCTIVRNEDSYTQLLMRAREELLAFKRKYSMLEELSEIMALIQ